MSKLLKTLIGKSIRTFLTVHELRALLAWFHKLKRRNARQSRSRREKVVSPSFSSKEESQPVTAGKMKEYMEGQEFREARREITTASIFAAVVLVVGFLLEGMEGRKKTAEALPLKGAKPTGEKKEEKKKERKRLRELVKTQAFILFVSAGLIFWLIQKPEILEKPAFWIFIVVAGGILLWLRHMGKSPDVGETEETKTERNQWEWLGKIPWLTLIRCSLVLFAINAALSMGRGCQRQMDHDHALRMAEIQKEQRYSDTVTALHTVTILGEKLYSGPVISRGVKYGWEIFPTDLTAVIRYQVQRYQQINGRDVLETIEFEQTGEVHRNDVRWQSVAVHSEAGRPVDVRIEQVFNPKGPPQFLLAPPQVVVR